MATLPTMISASSFTCLNPFGAARRPRVSLVSRVPSASAVDNDSVSQDDSRRDSRDDKHIAWRADRRTMLTAGAIGVVQFALASRNTAFADVKIALSNLQASSIQCPSGQITVGGRTSFGAACFQITGEAQNPMKQSVYNADIFGRVYDAQGEPALDAAENLRIDTIAELPPGKSKISFKITVNAAQANLGPLELKNFKATGYLGKVNDKQGSGRFDEIDFSELEADD